MLKKSQMTPARSRRAETRPSPSFVLASLKGSTYGQGKRLLLQAMGGRVKIVCASPSSLAAAAPAERHVLAPRGWAGETVGLFEDPAGCSGSIHDGLPWRR